MTYSLHKSCITPKWVDGMIDRIIEPINNQMRVLGYRFGLIDTASVEAR